MTGQQQAFRESWADQSEETTEVSCLDLFRVQGLGFFKGNLGFLSGFRVSGLGVLGFRV